LGSSSSEDEEDVSDSDQDKTDNFHSPPKKKTRATTNLITPKLAAALDRTKISDRMATFVIAETVQSLGHSIDDFNVNRSSIKRKREEFRAQFAAALKDEFAGNVPLTVHWDGKLMADLSGNVHVDRLPIIVTGYGISQLLKVSKMAGGTGEEQSSAVIQTLKEWNVEQRVIGMCFDTTSSNTGCNVGTCTKLEQKLGRDLLHFACRHHIMELLAGAAFGVCLGSTSGPEVLLFKRFKDQWSFIDQKMYSTSADVAEMSQVLDSVREDVLKFAEQQLQQRQVRDDYREFIELSVIFLGGSPARGIKFMAPGPMHHARWMSKVIYCLKIWLFRFQFKLTAIEKKGLGDMCVFSVVLYLRAWVTAPLAASAPRSDLKLLEDLYNFREYHAEMSKATCKKLMGHLWYLSEQLVGLAFFDTEVPITTKSKMVAALQKKPASGIARPGLKRITIQASTASTHSLEDFVSFNTRALLEKLHISVDFLDHNPMRDDYNEGVAIINKLHVINDHAERGVALVQELNQRITHDEDQFQFLIQVVAEHRRQYSKCQKAMLM